MKHFPLLLSMLLCTTPLLGSDVESRTAPQRRPTIRFHPAPVLQMPHDVDCNTPSHWDGGKFYVFNSTGHPYRSFGTNLFHLGAPESVQFDNKVNGGRWIEATRHAQDGTLYGWYHNEPGGLCPGTSLTAPRIWALRSRDNGATWKDLGLVMEAGRTPSSAARRTATSRVGTATSVSCSIRKQSTSTSSMAITRERPRSKAWLWHACLGKTATPRLAKC